MCPRNGNGDKNECTNFGGIGLLSIPEKMNNRVIIERVVACKEVEGPVMTSLKPKRLLGTLQKWLEKKKCLLNAFRKK